MPRVMPLEIIQSQVFGKKGILIHKSIILNPILKFVTQIHQNNFTEIRINLPLNLPF